MAGWDQASGQSESKFNGLRALAESKSKSKSKPPQRPL
jgi:hypothetical protein